MNNKKLNQTGLNYYSIVLTGICCMVSFDSAAQAQVSFDSCADIQNSDERLSCYDQAMAGSDNLPVLRLPRGEGSSSNSSPTVQTAPAVNAVSNVETESISREGNGGISDEFGLELKQERSVSADIRNYTVASASHNDFTGWTIKFDDGSTWRQVGTVSFNIEVNESYTIQRATLNSFLLSSAESNRKIRVARLN